MKLAFLFSGQGSQFVGMTGNLHKNEIAYNTYCSVQEKTGIAILEISNNGTEEIFNKSNNTQLAIVTLQAAILNIFKASGISSQATAGLSLGEYPALYNAGAFTQNEMFELVNARGKIMQNFADKNPKTKMMVVLGLDANVTKSYVDQLIAQGKIIAVANYNSLQQQVVGGNIEALEAFKNLAKDAKKFLLINVKVPSHTPLMEPIVEDFTKEINKIKFTKLNQDFYGNITGEKTPIENVKDGLVKQLTNSTHIATIIKNMLNDGIDTFVEIGPKKVLGSFVKNIAKKMEKNVIILVAKDIESTESIITQLKEK